MAINFSNNKYSVNIKANQVNAETYEVNNLIEHNLNARKRGFRAEYFIRPPIDVVFNTDTNIDVMFIVIGLKLNEHHVTGIELYFSKYDDENQFNFVAKHYTNAEKICVRNACFRSNGKLADIAMPSLPKDTEQFNIASRYIRHCYDVRQIKLKIIKTINSTVSCLSCFDVWAQPIRSVSPQTIAFLTNNCLPQQHQQFPNNTNTFNFYGNSQPTNEIQNNQTSNKRSRVHQISREDVSIPAEFIDPITCDIMSIPVLMPSGKNIDQTTLDKYLESEALWGRTANDPFTTVPFNINSKPIVNHVLKLRIDQFLSQNSEFFTDESRPSKRIAGYSSMFNNLNALRTSRLVFNENQTNSGIRSNTHCSECNESHDPTRHALYKLSCSHLICRDKWLKKLSDKTELKCSFCDSPLLTKDVVKLQ